MTRLIDADSLKDYIDCGHLRPPTELCFSELDVCNMIDKRPTIDAVEVVRCKDCRHWNREIHNGIEYFNFSSCDLNHYGDGHNFYCADAERREP